MKSGPEDNTGLKRLFTLSQVYEFFQSRILGGRNARRWLAKNFWKLQSDETVIDIGCGPGTILEYLPPDITYYGVDVSENYINAARARFATRGTFFLGTARNLLHTTEVNLKKADVVICNGLLHHLPDDEAIEVLQVAKKLLKLKGRALCLEATFLSRQSRLSRRMVSMDRGRYVRSEEEWKKLIGRVFESYSTRVLTGLIRIPYTHIIIECVNETASGEESEI